MSCGQAGYRVYIRRYRHPCRFGEPARKALSAHNVAPHPLVLAAAHHLWLLAAFTTGAATLEKETAFGQFAVARQFGGRRYLLGQQGHTQARYRFKQQARIGMARLIEHLGGASFAYAQSTTEHPLTIELRDNRDIVAGSRLDIGFDPARAYIFDKTSGQRLR